jgi:hypothetical protein
MNWDNVREKIDGFNDEQFLRGFFGIAKNTVESTTNSAHYFEDLKGLYETDTNFSKI